MRALIIGASGRVGSATMRVTPAPGRTAGQRAGEPPRDALSVYGHSKADDGGDALAAGGAVVGRAGVFCTQRPPGKNFVVRLIASLREKKPVTVPTDQLATPAYSDDLAAATYRIALRRGTGMWHVGGPDMLSRFDLARAVAEEFALDASTLRGVTTTEPKQKAARPLAGGLRNARYEREFGAEPVRPVRDALREMRDAMSVAT